MKALEKCVPRYLFRTFSSQSGGGLPGLNNRVYITPHAFLQDSPYTYNPYDLEDEHFRRLVERHVFDKPDGKSPFSSWTPSVLLALSIARWMDEVGQDYIHIAVIDTREVGSSVKIWHTPRLMRALSLRSLAEPECLVYGMISGSGFKPVRYNDIQEAGMITLLPQLKEPSRHIESWTRWYVRVANGILSRRAPVELNEKSMHLAISIASLFEPMQFAVASALACLEMRPWDRRREADNVSVRIFRQVLADDLIDRHKDDERWIRNDDHIDLPEYPELHQWVTLMRTVKNTVHGIRR